MIKAKGSTITRVTADQSAKENDDGVTVNPDGPPPPTELSDTFVRRETRSRRLPAWYKDYDTGFNKQEDDAITRQRVQAQLPPGIVLEDPADTEAAGKTDVPTEEWNIVVYDDEEDEDDGEYGQDGGGIANVAVDNNVVIVDDAGEPDAANTLVAG